MIRRPATLILAVAAFACASAFAEGGMVSSSTGTSISSGTGVIVGQGAPTTTVTVLPSSNVAVTTYGNRLLPGAAQVQASQTTVLGGPAAGGVSGSQTVVTNYWVNVPANAERRADFQRWLSLKP
jgi:hypothetical protein